MESARQASRLVTRTIPLRHLNAHQRAICETLRKEAGRCWSHLVRLHKSEREVGHWMTDRELEVAVAHGYALHSQTVQALAQRLGANVRTALANERYGHTNAVLPHRTPEHQTVTWKDMAVRVREGQLLLANGRRNTELRLALPTEYYDADIRRAELTWRADHYELCLTIALVDAAPSARTDGCAAGVDLGEVHIAALVTSSGHALVVSGRRLRACKRLRNKRHTAYRRLSARCSQGSRRWKRLRGRHVQASARFIRQQRDILHKASRKAVAFAQAHQVATLYIGDVRDVGQSPRRGKNNQKLSQWAHGQFSRYLTDKAYATGIDCVRIPEDFSTVTCSRCGHQRASGPRARLSRCPGCGELIHRDVNGAANICSRGRCGRYGYVQVSAVTFVRPLAPSAPSR